MRDPLPCAWIDRIFSRIGIRYGIEWTRRWEGYEMKAVKADWAQELGGLQQNPTAISHGLDNLPPEKPPTATQFKALCVGAPCYFEKQLPAPKADSAVVAAVVSGVPRGGSHDPKAWARRLRERDEAGEKLPSAIRTMYRAALASELHAKDAEESNEDPA
jgi:hypothetical protein